MSEYAAAGLSAGDVALIQRGTCLIAAKVDAARRAGARAVIVFNEGQSPNRTTHDFGYFSACYDGECNRSIVIFASYKLGFDLSTFAQSREVIVRLTGHNLVHQSLDSRTAHHNIISKNTAENAADENCPSNEWTKNIFSHWSDGCMGPAGTGSRARLY